MSGLGVLENCRDGFRSRRHVAGEHEEDNLDRDITASISLKPLR